MATRLYIGTGDGVVTVARNGGGAFEIKNHALKGWEITQVTVDPNAAHRAFAATRGDGVWRTDDSGEIWTKPSYGRRGPGKVRCLAFDPEGRTLYAGGEPIELFRSDDLGRTWEVVESVHQMSCIDEIEYPVAGVEPHVRDIAFDPQDPRTIYLALQVGYILKSTDGGATWRRLEKDLDADVHGIVVHPRDGRRVLIATGGHDSRGGLVAGRALYGSKDGGESWEPLAMNFTQEYAVPLTMHPRNPDVLYSAVANGTPGHWRRPTGAEAAIIRSRDGGQRWEPVGESLSLVSGKFPNAIVFDQAQPDNLYMGFRTGEVIATHNGGESWEDIGISIPGLSDLQLAHA